MSERLDGGDGHDLAPLIDAVREIVARTGSIPSERVVAEKLQVKRHRLRQALETLRANGELDPARAGRRAASDTRLGDDLASGTNPIEIIEMRLIIEPALARLAALRASPAEIKRMERAATTTDDVEPGAVDLAFHKAVAAGSRNRLASELYTLLRYIATDARLKVGQRAGGGRCLKRIAERDREHAAIAAAIAARDPEGAERAMHEHLLNVQKQILARRGRGARQG
jgi:DNA-binding FadR family transcriptional regulator